MIVENSDNLIVKPTSILDLMVDGKEFETLIGLKNIIFNAKEDIQKSLKEISLIRKRPIVCYVSNIVNAQIKGSVSIDNSDGLPFSEMVKNIPFWQKELDVLLVTPGGSGTQVAKFVDTLRPRFENVAFILPNSAMSAGTIFVMSGNDIIMTGDSYIGPIDPQVPNKQGQFVPAQALQTLITDIQKRGDDLLKKGQKPLWTDLQIINSLDHKELGNAISGSSYSIEIVKDYLLNYKFSSWNVHGDGRVVSDIEKAERANLIANLLCDHGQWKSHSRGITREKAWEVCKLKITHSESINGLDRALQRFWAMMYFIFQKSYLTKVFASENYFVGITDPNFINNK